ncbi:hypothetical protein BJX62DRAFT_215082 [Aspergillus germanicus]
MAEPKEEEEPETVQEESSGPKQPEDWVREKLESTDSVSIIYPLSEQASALVKKYSAPDSSSDEESLAVSLKSLILQCERIFELRIRTSVIVKYSDDLVLKVFPGSRDLTEYYNLQYFAENVPELPIPKPHGLLIADGRRISDVLDSLDFIRIDGTKRHQLNEVRRETPIRWRFDIGKVPLTSTEDLNGCLVRVIFGLNVEAPV